MKKQLSKLCYEIKWFFLEQINWCHKTDRNGNEKKPSIFYNLYCYLFYPIPWMENPCWCCASVRGLVYGIVLGFVLGKFIYGM